MDLANYCLMQVLVMGETEDEYEEIVSRYEEALAGPCWVKEMQEGIRKLENALNTDE